MPAIDEDFVGFVEEDSSSERTAHENNKHVLTKIDVVHCLMQKVMLSTWHYCKPRQKKTVNK